MIINPEISNQPECVECGGKCCEHFLVYVGHNGKDNALEAAYETLKTIAPTWELTTELSSPGGLNEFTGLARCTAHTPEGCSIYDTRPDACKVFPNARELSRVRNGGNCECPLILRMLAEEPKYNDEEMCVKEVSVC